MNQRIALPWSRSCFVCGTENPIGLRARSYLVDDHVELAFTPRPEHAGWTDVVHGGLITTVLDEVMTWAAIVVRERACFAADFSVRLRTPLAPGTPCTAIARVESERRRVLGTAAELVGTDGTAYATASGRYVSIPPEKMTHMEQEWVTEPGGWPIEKLFDPS